MMDRSKIKPGSLLREYKVLRRLGNHPALVGFHGAYRTLTEVAFVLEVCEGGELFENLLSKGSIPESDARIALRFLGDGLQFLHSRGIIHRDIKPENVLLTRADPNPFAIAAAPPPLALAASASATIAAAAAVRSGVAASGAPPQSDRASEAIPAARQDGVATPAAVTAVITRPHARASLRASLRSGVQTLRSALGAATKGHTQEAENPLLGLRKPSAAAAPQPPQALSLPPVVPFMKITDFGLSQVVGPTERLIKVCGTWAYSAPEAFDPTRPGYDCHFDTFSFGVLIFVVLSGYHPFDPTGQLPVSEIKARARNVQYDFLQPEWDHISTPAKDLIARLLVRDPQRRLDSTGLLRHLWFSDKAALYRVPLVGSALPMPPVALATAAELVTAVLHPLLAAGMLMDAQRSATPVLIAGTQRAKNKKKRKGKDGQPLDPATDQARSAVSPFRLSLQLIGGFLRPSHAPRGAEVQTSIREDPDPASVDPWDPARPAAVSALPNFFPAEDTAVEDRVIAIRSPKGIRPTERLLLPPAPRRSYRFRMSQSQRPQDSVPSAPRDPSSIANSQDRTLVNNLNSPSPRSPDDTDDAIRSSGLPNTAASAAEAGEDEERIIVCAPPVFHAMPYKHSYGAETGMGGAHAWVKMRTPLGQDRRFSPPALSYPSLASGASVSGPLPTPWPVGLNHDAVDMTKPAHDFEPACNTPIAGDVAAALTETGPRSPIQTFIRYRTSSASLPDSSHVHSASTPGIEDNVDMSAASARPSLASEGSHCSPPGSSVATRTSTFVSPRDHLLHQSSLSRGVVTSMNPEWSIETKTHLASSSNHMQTGAVVPTSSEPHRYHRLSLRTYAAIPSSASGSMSRRDMAHARQDEA
jgi:serine/threonine protein kinase